MRKQKDKRVSKTLKFMLKTAWKQKPSLFFAYIIMLLTGVVSSMQAVILPKLIIDELMLIISGEEILLHQRRVFMFALLTVGIVLVCNLIGQTARIMIKDLRQEWFAQYFDTKLAKRAMEMDFEHTENPDVLDSMNKAKEGMSWYSGGITGILDQFFNIIQNLLTLLGVSVIILFKCPLLLPLLVVCLVISFIVERKIGNIEVHYFDKLAKKNRVFGYYTWQLTEFQYGKDIRLYDSAKMMGDKTREINNMLFDSSKEQEMKTMKLRFLENLGDVARYAVSYFYIGWLAVTKVLTVGDFTMCISSCSTLYQSLSNILLTFIEINKRCRYASKYLDFMEYKDVLSKGKRKISKGRHVIEFKNVSFKYPRSENYVLRNVSIKIQSGEHLSIVGLNGAGKTTFIKLLCRMYDVTEGEILIDGVNIKEYSDEEYRKLFAVVFQDFKLFAFSLKENIVLGGEYDEDRFTESLKMSGLYEDAMKLEQGADTMIFKSYDEHGTELSGGQQQKTAICRALYKDAPIVILDEPTAALDPMAEYEIYRKFNDLVGGKTAIYISHRLSSCKFCDKIAVFSDDTIKEYGTHDELANIENGIYARMYSVQAKYYA